MTLVLLFADGHGTSAIQWKIAIEFARYRTAKLA